MEPHNETPSEGLVTALEWIRSNKGAHPENIFKVASDALNRLKHPNERAVDAMFASATGGMITPRHALAAILGAGLLIVEASK
jgi:hypothetical protein